MIPLEWMNMSPWSSYKAITSSVKGGNSPLS